MRTNHIQVIAALVVPAAVTQKVINTHAQGQAELNYIATLCRFDAANSPLRIFLDAQGIDEFEDLASLSVDELNNMTYLDPADGVVKPVPLGPCSCVKIIIHLFHMYNNLQGHVINIQSVTDEMFWVYHLSTYNPNRAFPAPFVPAHAGIPPAPPAAGGAAPTAVTEADRFCRGIHHDINHYNEFHDKKQWDPA